uniref:Uncharacterized protein n=1 Tax=Triticum urartu TaxID=4572 RepID=A0A8R7QNX8_TRIUA
MQHEKAQEHGCQPEGADGFGRQGRRLLPAGGGRGLEQPHDAGDGEDGGPGCGGRAPRGLVLALPSRLRR